ncbi:hypothetical protein G6F22_019688 [Rhizopus arrhizus]|nr:hypothetical protein G6F22_019688 [Rhizopus arrhizus]
MDRQRRGGHGAQRRAGRSAGAPTVGAPIVAWPFSLCSRRHSPVAGDAAAMDRFRSGARQVAGPNAIRISLGGVKDREELAQALARLAELMRRRPYAQRDPIV